MMGGSETEAEQRNIPRLPLFNLQTMMHSPERPSGTLTPPHHTSASVPFGWEEEPGKPRPFNALVSFTTATTTKSLELPPRLMLLDDHDHDATKLTKVISKTYRSPSFRGLSKGVGIKEKGWFGSWRGRKGFKVSTEMSKGSSVFPSSADRETDDGQVGVNVSSHKKVRVTKKKCSRSFYNLFHAKLWTRMCKGLKHVVPWKSKKLKKDGYGGGLWL